MTSISKHVYIHKLADIVHKCNNIYHSTIKIGWLKSSTHIGFNKKNNILDSNVKVADHVRISKYKNIFAKAYIRNWLEEFFLIKQRIINTVPWTYVISDFTSEETVETFHEKEL